MSSPHREEHIRAAVPCPTCGASIGEPCRQGTAPHDYRRGAVDLRVPLGRCHAERRQAWQQWKMATGRQHVDTPIPTPCPVCGHLCSSRTQADRHCDQVRIASPPTD